MKYQRGSVVLDRRVNIWYFRWKEDGKRKSERIGTLAQYPTKAKAKRAAEGQSQKINETPSAPGATLGEVVTTYRKEKMPKRKCTERGYNVWLNGHILPKWEHTPVKNIEAGDVDLWLRNLKLGQKSKAEIRGLMSRLIDCAMLWKIIPVGRNPMELVEVKDVKPKRKARVLTVGEFIRLRNQLDEPFRTMVCVAQFHGLGASEVLGFKWGDVDWLNATIQVQRSVVCQVEDTTKTANREAKLPLDAAEVKMLKAWRAQSEFTEPTNYIFASPHLAGEKPYHYTSFMWKLEKAAERAGIAKLSTHTFRHTYRSLATVAGIPVAMIKDLMRHATIGTSMNVYGAPVESAVREAQKKIAKLLND